MERNCDFSKFKCPYKDLVRRLNMHQLNGKTGFLGPVSPFKGLDFFKTIERPDISATDLVKRYYLKDFDEYVVLGDLHGDLLAFLGCLNAAGLIDQEANWIKQSKRIAVLQLGDMVDKSGRGEISRNSSSNPMEEINLICIAYLFA
jgi:hypothetical protein